MTKNPSPREPALGPASDLGLWLGGYRPEESTDNTDGTAILVPRRRPVQHRSRERFARILAAAREVLLESGVESFTFDAVARRADVPIGTLYQFFANKYALICELDRADSSAVTEEMRGFLEETPSAQWPRVVEELIDRMARLWRTDPSRRAVWHAVQSTPATRTTTMANQMPVVALVALVGFLVALRLGSRLDALALGDGAARHIGVNVAALRTVAIVAAALLTAAAVAFAGLIGFVGLIVPHIIRSVTGPANTVLVPASALGGAARTVR